MNNFKKTGGFTLVELIVVIAILGILAAVAVPAYSGYITKANEAADIVQLDAIKTAAMATMAEEGGVEEIELTVNTTSGAITAVEADGETLTDDDDFEMYYGSEDLPTMQSDTYKAASTITWYAAEKAAVGNVGDANYDAGHDAGWVVG